MSTSPLTLCFPPPCVPLPVPSACDPGPSPHLCAGLVSTLPLAHACLWTRQDHGGALGPEEFKACLISLGYDVENDRQVLAPLGPSGPGINCSSLSLLLSVSLPLAIPPLAILCAISPALLPPPRPVSLGTFPLTWSLGATSVSPAPRHCPVSLLCTWGGPSCLLWA